MITVATEHGTSLSDLAEQASELQRIGSPAAHEAFEELNRRLADELSSGQPSDELLSLVKGIDAWRERPFTFHHALLMG